MLNGRIAIVASLLAALPSSISRAERVGYSFTGAFQGSSSQTYTLFGITVPRNSPISGTFSYDTTAAGLDVEPGVRTFHQYISGGYTLDINNGDIQLFANDYTITVANDFDSPASDIFTIEYDFNSGDHVTPEPLQANGATWLGPIALIEVVFSWDAATFDGPDEPKLTGDRPQTTGSSVFGFVASSPFSRPFLVTSVSENSPLPGDYNYDGKVSANDFVEWRRAFGETEPQFLYADGNNDSVVDAADYVIWRKALAENASLNAVPEPNDQLPVFAGVLLCLWSAKPWRRDVRQR